MASWKQRSQLKEGAIWSIDKEVPGITLDTTTGEVIISHTAVQAESEVTARAKPKAIVTQVD